MALFLVEAYLFVVSLPGIPAWPRSDSLVFLGDAQRMVEGQAIYRDFFELTYPGAPVFYAAMLKLFGATAWIPALTMTVLGAAAAWLTLLIARYVVGPMAAILAGVATIALPVFFAPDPTHHWFSAVAILGATLLLLRDSRRSHLAAAAVCAVAMWFTQSKGALAALAFGIWLIWRARREGNGIPWRRLVEAGACFAATLVLLCGYFVVSAGPRVFWNSTVTFLFDSYGTVDWNAFPVYLHAMPNRNVAEVLAFGFVHAVVPLVYVLFLVRYARESRRRTEEPWAALMLVELAGLALFAAIMKAPSEYRLSMASMPAIILLVWMLYRPGRIETVARWVLWASASAMLIAGPITRQAQRRWRLDLPIGQVALSSPSMAVTLDWLRTHTHPGEYCFGEVPTEFGLQLRQGAPIPFTSGGNYTPPEQVRDLIAGLEANRVPLLLLSARAYMPFDGPDHLGPFRSYIHSNYRLVKVLAGTTEVWVRNGTSLPQ